MKKYNNFKTVALALCLTPAAASAQYEPITSTNADVMTTTKAIAHDFNQDGYADLVVLGHSAAGTRISIMLGQADNTLNNESVIALDYAAIDFATADFNGDGLFDLAIIQGQGGASHCGADGGIAILLGLAGEAPSFEYVSCYAADASALNTTDVDFDGNADLILDGTLALLGAGDATFDQELAITGNPDDLYADMNGDGLDDIVLAQVLTTRLASHTTQYCGTGRLYVPGRHYRGRTRTFCTNSTIASELPATSAVLIRLADGNGNYTDVLSPVVDGTIDEITVADTDGDGINDVIISTLSGDKRVTLQDPVTWRWHSEIIPTPAPYEYNEFKIFDGVGDGSLADPVSTIINGFGKSRGSRIAADFNGDGATDFSWLIHNPGEDDLVGLMFHTLIAAPPPVDNPPPPVDNPPPPPVDNPPPSGNGDVTPTGEELELKGTVTEVGDGYFIVEGIRVNYDPDVLQMEDGFGDTIQVGHPIETTGDEYSDGSITATMVQVG